MLLIISLLMTGFASSDYKPTLGGKALVDTYLPYRDLNHQEIRQIDFSLRPQSEMQFDETKSVYAEGVIHRFQKKIDNQLGGGAEKLLFDLYEGYFSYKSPGFDLKFGKQVIAWGKSDGVNPTDVHTARDGTWFNPADDLKKIGSFSLLANYTLDDGVSPVTFTIVLTPIFAQSQMLVAKNTMASGFNLREPQSPDPGIENSELAFKTAYNASQWDVSGMFFKGYDHLPHFAFDGFSGSLLAPVAVVTPKFRKITVLGGDFSAAFSGAFSDYVVRVESAHTWTENSDGRNPLITPSHFDAVIGGERPFFTDYRLQVQWVTRAYTVYEPPEKTSELIGAPSAAVVSVNNALAASNALLHDYQYSKRNAFTLRFAYTDPSQNWDAEIFTMMYFEGRDSVIRPKGSYLIAENFRSTLGLEHYDGPEGNPLGSLRKYDSVFLELKYSF